MEPVSTSELPWRDSDVVQLVSSGFFSDVWSPVLECDLPVVSGLLVDTNQWYSTFGEARFKEMGSPGRVPKV